MFETIEQICQKKGVKLTDQRKTIARVVSESKKNYGESDHPDVDELYKRVQKIDPKIRIIDPSKALIKKFNESFAIPKTYRYESLPYENVQFFVTSDKDEFAKKVKFWLEVHKEIRLVNLRSNV